jgi:hypothetical protein
MKSISCAGGHLGFLINIQKSLCRGQPQNYTYNTNIKLQMTMIFFIRKALKLSQSNCIMGLGGHVKS